MYHYRPPDVENGRSAEEPRAARLVRATIEHPVHGAVAVTLRNISSHGLGGRCEQSLRPGEQVGVLTGMGRRIEAEIRWVRGGQFGLMTREPIAPEDFIAGGARDSGISPRRPDESGVRIRTGGRCYRPSVRG